MGTDLDRAFGEVVRKLRLSRGMSQEELSFACGRHRTYISLIERGRNAPSIETIWMLARALEILPSEMLRDTEALLADAGGSPPP